MIDNKRYYAFDSLRATMMLLGIVIHSAMTFSSKLEIQFSLKAKETSDVFYFIIYFIHTFRMPIFFLVAGFFGSFLFYNKSPNQMLKNRFRRIFLPFLVFLLLLQPVTSFAFKYYMALMNGEMPISLSKHFSNLWSYVPFSLGHLWFLYYLFIISVLTYLFLKLTKRISMLAIDNLFKQTFENPLYRLLAMTIILFIILFLFDAKNFETSINPIPDLGILTYFLSFYITGWLLYRKKELVNTLKRYDIMTTILGVILFCLKNYFDNQMSLTILQLLNSLITCSLTLGIIGLFLRFADKPNNKATYFVNSAYWVYLFHFFITILLSGLVYDLTISIYLKYLIVLITTTIICLTTYHFFVRQTFIGVFLNGKKT
jgi:glucan biosynthesis protein C